MSSQRFGVLGRTLGHSYSPIIHTTLAGLDYTSFEKEPEEIVPFLASSEWDGLNVTIPYKRTVVPYLDELTERAQRLGNVNTIWRDDAGRLHGDNTDYLGFKMLVESTRVDVSGNTVLVLGATGGAGTTASIVLEDMGANVIPVSRKGNVTYNDLDAYADAVLIVNCTPVGMYPSCPSSPIDLGPFTKLEAVCDIVYNPARTGLILQAEKRGIPAVNGLLMLVAQAAEADRHFCGAMISAERIAEVTDLLTNTEQNIALIGMPGSGKTRVGEQLANLLGREHVDIDKALQQRLGTSCSSYILENGEAAFREQETIVLSEIARSSRLIISTGGGIVTREENYPLLHQNSVIVMLNRKLEELSHKDRPITARDGEYKLAETRMPLYRAWSDLIIDSRESAESTARAITEILPTTLNC